MLQQFVSLMYHNVIRDGGDGACAELDGLGPSITRYFVKEAEFARQLDAIGRIADVLSYADMQRLYFGTDSQRCATDRLQVQLTFDDGWRGAVEVAGPLLADRGLQALVFVTTGLIGSRHFLTADALAHLPPLTFHVGSHTVTHRFLNELPDAEIRSELRHSRQALEDIVGYPVDVVSIPNGAADERVVRIAAECGYRFVCLSDVHVNNRLHGPLAIGRVAIRSTMSVGDIERYARGDFRAEQFRARLLSLPKRILGAERYRRTRSRLLGQSAEDHEMSDLVGESTHRVPAATRPLSVADAPSQHGGTRTKARP